MRIQHNIAAMNSYRNFSANNSSLNKNLEKLSTGYKINRAGDDAAGLAISEKMRAQITGLEGATKNSKDGISLIQTAEGALTEVHDMLNRMTTLAEQSANGTYQNELDREQLQKEVDALKSEIDRIADSTNFNGLKLLDGSLSDKFETTKVLDSALTGITENAYVGKGASDAFSVAESTIVTRPEANDTQTAAKFTVDLNGVSLAGQEKDDVLKLQINGEDTITLTLGAKDAAGAAGSIGYNNLTDLESVVDAFFKFGNGVKTITAANIPDDVNDDGAKTASEITTAAPPASSAAPAGDGSTYNAVKVNGHWYKMTKSAGADGKQTALTFEQIDKTENNSDPINPAFSATVTGTDTDEDGSLKFGSLGSQHANVRVQDVRIGESVGTSRQAEAEVAIDFSKLKDGDKLVAGDKTFVFAVGKNSSLLNAAGTALDENKKESYETYVDLTSIFKESEDQGVANKQNEALAKITQVAKATHQDDNAGDAWIVGDKGVNGGIGTLTFQSNNDYKDGKAKLGGNTASDETVNMSTVSNIKKQFYGTRAEAAATTTFDLDVTKIKTGDTFTVDDKTFEFTDGKNASGTGNIAIDLSSLGIADGILSGQRGEVVTAMKTAIEDSIKVSNADGNPIAKYAVTNDGDKVTLTSKDNAATDAFENRVSAKLTTPTETTYGEGLVLQIGDTAESFNKLTVSIEDMHTNSLGIGDVDISTQEGAAAALDKIKTAINSVSDTRGNMGALQNRLEHTINNLGVMRENIQSAESQIRDTDVAEEMMTYTKNNILNQSAQAMLAQANQLPQGVLQLLG